MKVVYPYPPPVLSPNARAHWSKIASAKKAVRKDAQYLTVVNKVKVDETKPLTLHIVFRPSTAARYDIDNALARCKALIDGIADAINMDDSKFKFQIERGDPFKGGAVEVTFKQD